MCGQLQVATCPLTSSTVKAHAVPIHHWLGSTFPHLTLPTPHTCHYHHRLHTQNSDQTLRAVLCIKTFKITGVRVCALALCVCVCVCVRVCVCVCERVSAHISAVWRTGACVHVRARERELGRMRSDRAHAVRACSSALRAVSMTTLRHIPRDMRRRMQSGRMRQSECSKWAATVIDHLARSALLRCSLSSVERVVSIPISFADVVRSHLTVKSVSRREKRAVVDLVKRVCADGHDGSDAVAVVVCLHSVLDHVGANSDDEHCDKRHDADGRRGHRCSRRLEGGQGWRYGGG
jgi:hypothetical protein